ncbi:MULTISPECIES: PAS domain-containing sensor histidine kinase [unclassified Azospirillum]|uniref:ATP-binding response regulator n=1 Tax=unclassified Azospirillum TaxID=2630922 RepID=UPI000B6C7943|nr:MULTISPECIES: PAS domain-containing sensor histidine kinase [unclassified Azospirillum]SNS95768.1 PAS domain S-box-containing protein [Azospirillum sp. RU38E]SNT12086.1 PAS domain S-box-containing protein [Azospirillum sp. RU37A]
MSRRARKFALPTDMPPARLVGGGLTLLVLAGVAGLLLMGRVEGPPPAEWPGGLRAGLLIWTFSALLVFGGLVLGRMLLASIATTQAQRRLFSRTLEACPLPQLLTGPDERALAYNPAFRDLARPGKTPPLTALASRSPSPTAGVELTRLAAAAARGMAGGVTLSFPDAASGQLVSHRVSARPVEGFAGHILWLVHPAPLTLAEPTPVSPPPLAVDSALAQLERRFQRLFDYAPIGIVLLDADLRVTECNDTVLALAGIPMAEVAGRSVGLLFQREKRADSQARLLALRDGRDGEVPFEVQLRGAPGPVVQVYARPVEGEAAGDCGLVLHIVDMTRQKSLEAQFVQSQKMQAIGQLAGGVAHDFNNLLTAMIGFCDLLLLRHKPGDTSFTDIMQIKQNANRAANLVRQLLAFSRQQTLQPRVLSVTDVLAELSNLLRRLIGENIELRMLHGRDLGLVKVDQGQLEQVIINLCVNARDAMQAVGGGKLTIVTSNLALGEPVRRAADLVPAGDYVVIEVLDTGIGIPPENLERIFEPFFSTKEVGSGTGLGLSTVYGIVRQTGGFVFVDSAPGDGAKFSIYLPRFNEADATVSVEKQERGSSDLTGMGSILLVEDEDAVRIFAARALRNKGYHVIEAKCGEAALGLLSADNPPAVDLIVTDVVMPQMDGPTMIRAVRETMPDVKVIFISGYAEERFRSTLGNDEKAEFLPKPFSLKQLAAKVKEVMEVD